MKRTLLVFAAFVGLIIFGCGGGGGGTSGGTNVTVGGTTGLSGVVVAFFDGGGTQVAQATTDANGDFSASVPTEARFFQVVENTMPASYANHYFYGSFSYTTIEESCRTPLPTLSNGVTTLLPNNIRIPASNPPPPAPNGCQQTPIGNGSGGTATVAGRVIPTF